MPRRFRALILGSALLLAAVVPAVVASASAAGPGSASATGAGAQVPPLPDSMAAIGDSITQAVDVCCFFGNWPSHSWSTGARTLDGITSHYERIRGLNPAMLNFFNSPADRQAVIDRERELNDALRDVCASWSNCRFDNYLTYNDNFAPSMVSKLDFFHPSLSGQATLATLTWQAPGGDRGRRRPRCRGGLHRGRRVSRLLAPRSR